MFQLHGYTQQTSLNNKVVCSWTVISSCHNTVRVSLVALFIPPSSSLWVCSVQHVLTCTVTSCLHHLCRGCPRCRWPYMSSVWWKALLMVLSHIKNTTSKCICTFPVDVTGKHAGHVAVMWPSCDSESTCLLQCLGFTMWTGLHESNNLLNVYTKPCCVMYVCATTLLSTYRNCSISSATSTKCLYHPCCITLGRTHCSSKSLSSFLSSPHPPDNAGQSCLQ